MFTVKIRFVGGNENIFEARRVEWINSALVREGHKDILPGVLIHYEDGGFSHYAKESERPEGQWQQIWVMNRDGNTVAQYSHRS